MQDKTKGRDINNIYTAFVGGLQQADESRWAQTPWNRWSLSPIMRDRPQMEWFASRSFTVVERHRLMQTKIVSNCELSVVKSVVGDRLLWLLKAKNCVHIDYILLRTVCRGCHQRFLYNARVTILAHIQNTRGEWRDSSSCLQWN